MRLVLPSVLLGGALLGSCRDAFHPLPFESASPSLALLGNQRVPVTVGGITCAGDTVEGAGIGHFHNTATELADGSLHITNHVNLTARGTALTSGATYILSSQEVLVLNLIDSSGNFTRVARFTMVGEGGAENLTGQIMMHLTVTPNGVVTASFDRGTVSCGV